MDASTPAPVSTPSGFKPDRIIGVIVAVVAGLSGLGMAYVMSTPMLIHDGGLFGLAGWVGILFAVLQMIGGIGLFRGTRSGLVFALVVAALSVFSGPGAAVGVYIILRLWGNVGPRPT